MFNFFCVPAPPSDFGGLAVEPRVSILNGDHAREYDGRGEFLAENPGNKGNGYRPRHSYGQRKKLEFRIPRDRYGNFHPQILTILRDQEEECDRLTGVLYTKGLTQEQVSDVFDQIYGQHYSKSSISRMVECVRTQVNEWLERGSEEYYPVVFVDSVHIKIHRKRSVASEAFYVALAITEEGTREVIYNGNMPEESAAMLLVGCSSAEPVSSSDCTSQLIFFNRITK